MPRILLCGKSLFISGLQAILASAPELDLQLVAAHPGRIRERVTRWKPDVLILETELLNSPISLSLLHDFPQMKLIGLDIEGNRLLVFSGSISYEPTPEQLIQIIRNKQM